MRVLVAGSNCLEKVPVDSDIGELIDGTLVSVGAPHWCFRGVFTASATNVSDASRAEFESIVERLQENHFQFLHLACHTSKGSLRQSSSFARSNSSELVDYARQVLLEAEVIQVPDLTTAAQEEDSFRAAVLAAMKDNSAARAARLAEAQIMPDRTQYLRTDFLRNPDVVAVVLIRAAGICEACKSPAPFLRASDGQPYLEVHHKMPLAMDGLDTVKNAIAVCPNCHRYAHFGKRKLA